MTKIVVGFSRARSNSAVFSKAIQWAEGTPYSHVYIRRKSNRVGEYVYQASGTSVNFMGIENFLKRSVIVEEYEFEIDDSDLSGLLKDMIKLSGSPYSAKQVWKLSKFMIKRKLGCKPKMEKVDGEETWICSELGGWLLKKHLHLDIEGELDMLTPKMLHDQLAHLGTRIA